MSEECTMFPSRENPNKTRRVIELELILSHLPLTGNEGKKF